MSDSNRVYDLVDRLSFVRVAGTDQEKQAAELLAEEIRLLGGTPRIEEFEISDGVISKATFEVLEPYRQEYAVTAYFRSDNTPPEGQVFDFLYVEDALPANLKHAKGKMVMFNGYLNYDLYEKLKKAEVAGVLGYSGQWMDEEDKTDLDTRKLRDQLTDAFGSTVALNIRARYAQELVVKRASKVRVCVQSEKIKSTSRNVIAEIKGTEYPDEIVSLGGHFDSLYFAPGAYDNAAGSGILIDLYRRFRECPPKRTLRFAWYGAEEQGLLGSKHDVSANAELMEAVQLMINIDLAGNVLGRNFAIVTGDTHTVSHLDALFKEAGYPVDVKQDIYSSDSIPFANIGIPGINFGRFGASGGSMGHNRFDTMDYISADSLNRSCEIGYFFIERLVNADVLPIERAIPDEMREKVDKYLKKKPDAKA